METSARIQLVIDYIEQNIEDALSSDVLTELSNFSKSQFFKLFMLLTGQTPMNYVVRRKLHFAAKRICSSETKIIDIAFQFGFESHDVFSRAFKRFYGVTPQDYRSRRYTLKEMKKITIHNKFEGVQAKVDVHVVEKPAMYLVGVEHRVGNGKGEMTFAEVWNDYFHNWQRRFGNVRNRVKPEDNAEYCLALFDQDGILSYFVGFEVEGVGQVSDGGVGRMVPALRYAKATHVGPPAETLGQTLDYVYGDWFANNTCQTAQLRNSPFSVMEYYDERCSSSPAEMDIFVPIKLPEETRMIDIPSFEAFHYCAVGNDLSKLKYEAVDMMLKWVEKSRYKFVAPLKLGIRYGETEEYESFCEVFFKAPLNSEFIETDKVKGKTYDGGTYAVTSSVHHFIEKDWLAFTRRLQQSKGFHPAGECFEEFIIENGKMDFYTEVNLYEKVIVE